MQGNTTSAGGGCGLRRNGCMQRAGGDWTLRQFLVTRHRVRFGAEFPRRGVSSGCTRRTTRRDDVQLLERSCRWPVVRMGSNTIQATTSLGGARYRRVVAPGGIEGDCVSMHSPTRQSLASFSSKCCDNRNTPGLLERLKKNGWHESVVPYGQMP